MIRNSKNPLQSVLLDVEGMKCGGCVQSVEKTLLSESSVVSAHVNLVERTALIELQDESSDIQGIIDALSRRGFQARKRLFSSEAREPALAAINQQKKLWQKWKQLMIALFLLILSVLGHLTEAETLQIPLIGNLSFHASLATFALFGPGLTILKSGLRAARYLTPNMDTLVGIGVSSAYLSSLSSLIWPQVGWPCFFNEPVMLLGFVLLGRFLEERARIQTGQALKELAKLQPETASLINNENVIKEVRVGALKPGEQIQLLAGDRIPIDGIVISGNSAVDVSSITGESLPIEAAPGTELCSGSLNLEGTLILKVQRIGNDTALARIIGLVEKAQARKAPIQRLADQVAGKFCFGVVGLAIFTFFFWWKIGTVIWPDVLKVSGQGLMHMHEHSLNTSFSTNAQTSLGLAVQLSIAVLVIACPCALGLATPTVITVASGKAAKKGWLFKGGDVIEKAALIKEMIFDKTGTLTIGKPQVIGILGSQNKNKLIQIAASLEDKSRHPIAHAILHEAEINEISLLSSSQVITFPGKGMSGELNGIKGTVRVGKIEWLQNEGTEINIDVNLQLKKSNYHAKSLVGVSVENQLLGLIIIDDQIREDAHMALQKLRIKGINLHILSGDRRQSVLRLGGQLGFKENQLGWELLPEEKLKYLEQLKKVGPVAMVGDGINDAPALAGANLGVAIGTGTQIAQDSADLVLMGDRLESLPNAILLADKTIKKVKQNLFWAFSYNTIALPVAAGILLPSFGILLSPPIAALLMALSSISVVINALTLKSS
ncbi:MULTISPECIES: cation-translocating P-type ATPase [Prochlorococcus]|uniref:heavy metal translocating P-type ATPase n=1 Tax=Prochlorococcus sp. MIT 0601 TaxID=1499498 RepID=UPI00056256A6|nr:MULTISPECIES: cation-translocating P-type ATPase [Prochlorococcus]